MGRGRWGGAGFGTAASEAARCMPRARLEAASEKLQAGFTQRNMAIMVQHERIKLPVTTKPMIIGVLSKQADVLHVM